MPGLEDIEGLLDMLAGGPPRQPTPQEAEENHNWNMMVLLAGFQGDDADAHSVRMLAKVMEDYSTGIRAMAQSGKGSDVVSKAVANAQNEFMTKIVETLAKLRELSVVRCAALGIELPKHPGEARRSQEDDELSALRNMKPGMAG